MKLSIITVTYNSAETVSRTIASIRDNAVSETESILIDNLSEDTTCDIARKTWPEVQIVSEKDSGIYDAMNKGIRIASGDIVACLNADDYYLPGALEEVIKVFQKHPETDIVHGNILVNGRVFHPPQGVFSFGGARIFHPAAFIRRNLLLKLDLFDCRYSICADIDFFLRAKQNGATFVHTDRVLTAFSLGGVSTRDRMRTAREMKKVLVRNGYSRFFIFIYYMSCRLRGFVFSIWCLPGGKSFFSYLMHLKKYER